MNKAGIRINPNTFCVTRRLSGPISFVIEVTRKSRAMMTSVVATKIGMIVIDPVMAKRATAIVATQFASWARLMLRQALARLIVVILDLVMQGGQHSVRGEPEKQAAPIHI